MNNCRELPPSFLKQQYSIDVHLHQSRMRFQRARLSSNKNVMIQTESAIQSVFHRTRVFLPVIHPISSHTALQSIETAIDSEADGIFLINQGMSSAQLLDFVLEVHHRFDKLWIGINLLGFHPEDVLLAVAKLPIQGIWSDNAGIDETSESQPAAERFRETRDKCNWKGLYFGGVAFKYQRDIPHFRLPLAANKAVPWMDVTTSSGPGTGDAASIEKVQALRSGAGIHPLAIASGISPENVSQFLPLVDCFLVASEIETIKHSGILVPERTKTLANLIHNWSHSDDAYRS